MTAKKTLGDDCETIVAQRMQRRIAAGSPGEGIRTRKQRRPESSSRPSVDLRRSTRREADGPAATDVEEASGRTQPTQGNRTRSRVSRNTRERPAVCRAAKYDRSHFGKVALKFPAPPAARRTALVTALPPCAVAVAARLFTGSRY